MTTSLPEVEPELRVGAMLGTAYRVLRRIGGGGMGAVYEVEHVRMRKRFAAKVLKRELSGEPTLIARLEREAIAASRIEHPNIVQVLNFDETADHRVYLIMELLQGDDLHAVLSQGPLTAESAISIAIPVARALAAAHRCGIIHRDLKPANIFLAQKGEEIVVKVVDFGIAKFYGPEELQRLTASGHVVGTPSYMSPEQAGGASALDGRTDVYSLGIILYETLTGRNPFAGRNPISILLKLVNDSPEPPVQIDATVPPLLSSAILRAIKKSPEDRFATMVISPTRWSPWADRSKSRARLGRVRTSQGRWRAQRTRAAPGRRSGRPVLRRRSIDLPGSLPARSLRQGRRCSPSSRCGRSTSASCKGRLKATSTARRLSLPSPAALRGPLRARSSSP